MVVRRGLTGKATFMKRLKRDENAILSIWHIPRTSNTAGSRTKSFCSERGQSQTDKQINTIIKKKNSDARIELGSVNLFWKGPNSKYFKLFGIVFDTTIHLCHYDL